MRVAVTGGTGFVGSHAVAALLNAGHEVRLLVRDPVRAANLAPLGVPVPTDIVTGDATDATAVHILLEGCDAVVHAASVFALDARKAKEIASTNVACTEIVLGEAAQRGLEHIVHVSSVAAFLPAWGQIVSGDSEIGRGVDAYTRSKGGSEAVARRHRAAGVPIVCVMPGGVIGPVDPYLSEINWQLTRILKGQLPLVPRSSMIPLVDVRDLARVILRAVEGAPPGSYTVAAGHDTARELIQRMARLTGRRLPAIGVPNVLARTSGDLADRMQPYLPWSLPLRGGTVREITDLPRVDSTAAAAHLGFTPRPLDESLADTIRWLAAAGHVSAKHAGPLAPEPTMAT